MYPAPVREYFAPTRVEEALTLIAQFGADAKVLAGGQSLLPQLKARELRPSVLIDLNRMLELEGLSRGPEGIRIGALVRHRELIGSPELAGANAALVEAASAIGDLQVRNRGTPVGSIVHRDHTGDIAPAAVVLGARLEVLAAQGPGRSVSVEGLQREPAPFAAGELVTHLVLPERAGGSAYWKHGRVTQDRAILGLAAWVRCDGSQCVDARLAVGGVAPAVQRLRDAEAALIGEEACDSTWSHVADLASKGLSAQNDNMATSAYRQGLTRTLLPKVLARAAHRAAAGASG